MVGRRTLASSFSDIEKEEEEEGGGLRTQGFRFEEATNHLQI